MVSTSKGLETISVALKLELEAKERLQSLIELSKRHPEHFLCIEHTRIGNVLLPMGIFSCTNCKKPILHNQFVFSGLCGACDVGKKSPKWVVVKPRM